MDCMCAISPIDDNVSGGRSSAARSRPAPKRALCRFEKLSFAFAITGRVTGGRVIQSPEVPEIAQRLVDLRDDVAEG